MRKRSSPTARSLQGDHRGGRLEPEFLLMRITEGGHATTGADRLNLCMVPLIFVPQPVLCWAPHEGEPVFAICLPRLPHDTYR